MSETKKYTEKELKELLVENVCVVDFTKVNGDKRSMPCTLDPQLVPQTPATTGDKKKKAPNPAVLNVWCTDAKGWRSFRIENVTDVTIVDQIK